MPTSALKRCKYSIIILIIFYYEVHHRFCHPVNGQVLNSSSMSASSPRKKRFAVFPEGSTFTVAMCVTLKLLTPDYDIFTEAVNWALTYDLPDSVNDYIEQPIRKPLPINVTKRNVVIYRILETLFKEYDVDGKACILRMLCESEQLLHDQRGFVQLILKVIVRYKTVFTKLADISYSDYQSYRMSCVNGNKNGNNCKEIFSLCPISFLHVILSV